ncbi:YceI family protein [Prosthecobacter dejongeii]|uniref:Rhodanese-related sulfurtransferase n=1 Tax=Prosthecobacter dejongeii TaxID=48465 RepID=A0A7W8DP19_9BACT|nr:YceI family protein [Prosthecobacter dejongeii]MBB5036978.1 rhodanese-related sulfurtransferase [Prosthecobacter dejongeii]
MNSPRLLSAQELNALRQQEPRLIIVDVRLPDDYSRRAIAGAVNNCVFEVTFQKRLEELIPHLQTPICVYGASQTSHEASMAAEKMRRAGYTKVYQLQGCLTAWCEAGLPEQGSQEPLEPLTFPAGHFRLDLTESRVEWLGRNLLNKHSGHLPIQSGYLDIQNETITGGEIVFAMNEITCDDLAGNPYHDVLIAHLRSDDFFDTELFPEARLTLQRASHIPGSAAGTQNLEVKAALTLKGVTHSIQFSAAAGLDAEGRYVAQAALSIDRTRWGVLYGSGRFFSRLAGHLVNDLIEIQVRVVTQPL